MTLDGSSKYIGQFELRKTKPREVKLLELVELGDVKAVSDYIKNTPGLDVNYEWLWRHHLVTPLHVAAEKDNIHMIDLLLRYNATPLTKSVSLREKYERMDYYEDYEDVVLSFQRLKCYEARSSIAYIALNSEDILMEAFQLRVELQKNYSDSKIEGFYMHDYKRLRDKVEQFAVDILNCCDSLSEIAVLLHGRSQCCARCCGGRANADCCFGQEREKWMNLSKAIETEHRTFVADEKCQQIILREWTRKSGSTKHDQKFALGWRKFMKIICFLFSFFLLQPVVALICILWPYCRLAEVVFCPIITSYIHQLSYLTFLVIHLYVSIILLIPEITYQQWVAKVHNQGDYVILIYIPLVYHVLWVLGSCLQVTRTIIYKGFRKHFSQLSNVMIIIWYLINVAMYVESTLAFFGIIGLSTVRTRWLLALSIIIGVSLVLKLLQNETFLGKLIISFKKMIPDVTRFFIVFVIVGLSFAATLYIFYYEVDYSDSKVYSFKSTAERIIWTLYGIQNIDPLVITNASASVHAELHPLKHPIQLENTTADNEPLLSPNDYFVIQTSGILLYWANSTLIFIVLLNLFIAMMSDTYTRIQEGIECDWRFERVRHMMTYIDSGIKWNLPSPYNLIAWPWYCILQHIERRRGSAIRVIDEEQSQKFSKKKLPYDTLMKILLYRYFKKRDENGTGNV
ncbi:short transient receptor potential channel 4-like [Ptychodera flava]|uniref:short transient receptor potential channel 4-like n=1 Tax=Ptychodera flava TaxID=63121 RepID=UPI00396A4C91